MYIVCARDTCPIESYTVVDLKTNLRYKLSRKEVLDAINSGNKFGNVVAIGDAVRGKGFPITSFSRHNKTGRVYLFEEIKNSGVTVGYRGVSAMGNVFNIPIRDEVFIEVAKKYGIVNGRLEYDERYEGHKIKLYENTYYTSDIGRAILNRSYDIEKYISLYRKYKNFGISKDRERIKDTDGLNDGSLEDTEIESFISYHKSICRVMSNVKEAKCSQIFNTYIVNYIEGKGFLCKPLDLWGVLVNLSVEGVQIKIPIHKKDLRLRELLSKIGSVVTEVTDFDKFLELFVHIEELSNQDSIITCMEKTSDFNKVGLAKLSSYMKQAEVRLDLRDGGYKSDSLDIFLEIRNDLKADSGDKRMLIKCAV